MGSPEGEINTIWQSFKLPNTSTGPMTSRVSKLSKRIIAIEFSDIFFSDVVIVEYIVPRYIFYAWDFVHSNILILLSDKQNFISVIKHKYGH